VAKEIAEKEAQRKEEAATTPFLAEVTAAVILDEKGDEIFNMAHTYGLSAHTLSAVEQHLPHSQPGQVVLFCFDARNAIRVIATDATRADAPYLQWSFDFWLRSSLSPVPWADPCDVFINTALKHDIGLGGLCKFLGISYGLGDTLPRTAIERAKLVRDIAIKGKLLRQ
jgi:hypothetical protein